MRAAIYARVSTSNHGLDPHVQTRELREHCSRRGWEIADEYVDSGISGTKERRPELDRLLADCRRRRVYRYDRFARSLRHLVNALEEFRALGIDFISLHEGVDTSTPNGRLVFGIFASIAEFERGSSSEIESNPVLLPHDQKGQRSDARVSPSMR
jgi:DNA invertase Pin-like site-specific DNA recombinase